MKIKNNNILRFLKVIYLKLFRIHDSPQKVALGIGIGVFLGNFPGTGPIAALTMAFILRINRAAALLGSLLTNTWLSIITFVFSVKIGSSIMGLEWQKVYQETIQLFKDFHWMNFFKISILKILTPVLIGYFIISFLFGLLFYAATLFIILKVKPKFKNKNYLHE
jgi:hypothetical protein